MEKKKINVLLLASSKNIKLWNKNEPDFKRYFKLEVIKDSPTNIRKYLHNSVDILILDDPKQFQLEYYKKFKNIVPHFLYITLYENVNPPRDIETYRVEIVDRIIYTSIDERFYKWSIMSVLRRFWSSHSKPSTIIYKNIIADFIDHKFWTNKREIELTPKEAAILRILLINKNEFVPKSDIFNKIWGHSGEDNTRTVDQTLFKLKNKIGKSSFVIKRNKGVKIR